ncbi:MAG: V-type ATPase subunit C [Bacteroidota bacterium]
MDYTTIIYTTTSSQSSAVLFGLMGAGSALILSSIGAAFGSSKPNIFHSQQNDSSSFNTQNKSKLSGIIPFIPIIIAGVLAIYGLIYSVIVLQAVTANDYNTSRGYAQFVGGLVLGFTCLASGIAVGVVGKNGLRAISENKSTPVRLVLNLIYCEAIGLYGLIFAIIAASAF